MTVFGPYAGVVDSVHDGDTVNVKLDVGFDLTVYARIRVFGINAPELATLEGKAARDFVQTLLSPGAPVRVISHGWDKFGGRVDAEVQFKTAGIFVDLAATMINAGHAKRWDGRGVKP